MRFSAPLLLVALLTPACAGSLRGKVVAGPEEFPGFPAHASDGVLMVEATFYENHEEIFGDDLTRFGYVPIAVRIGIRERDGIVRRLSSDTIDAHLYFQDGTPISWVPYEDLDVTSEGVVDHIAKQALILSVLPEWHDAHEGFLFFRFDDDVRVNGENVLTTDGEYHRELDLLQSLISLDVSTSKGTTRMNVGLRGGHHSDS